MQVNHCAAASFAESGLVDRYLEARKRYIATDCQFVILEQETRQELTRSALSHAYQQGWISVNEFQRWNSQLAKSDDQ